MVGRDGVVGEAGVVGEDGVTGEADDGVTGVGAVRGDPLPLMNGGVHRSFTGALCRLEDDEDDSGRS